MTGPALLVLLVGCISVTLNGLLIRFADHLPFSKKPSADRWHRDVVPDSGGIAVFCALAFAYLAGFRGRHGCIALVAVGMWVLGVLDDRLQVSARIKFCAQAALVGAALWSGVVFEVSSYRFVNLAISWVWLLGITNAFNLIDNMDGLAAGVIVITALFRAGLLYAGGFTPDAVLCAAIASAFLGFLVFNLKPAKIFMGNGGSMLAGFSLAALTIDSPLPHARSLLAGFFYPALTFAYPIFDTTLVSILRRGSGRPISVGGRDHSSHRLASLGMHESTVVYTLWGFTAVGSAAGLMSYRLAASTAVAISLVIVFATMFGIFLASLPAFPVLRTPAVGRLRMLRRWIPSLRAGVTVVLDSLIAVIALVAAFVLRFDLDIPDAQYHNLLISLPVVLLGHGMAGVLCRTYDWSWEFFGLQEILPLAGAAGISAMACLGLSVCVGDYSRGIVIIYFAAALTSTILVRSSLRIFRQTLHGASPAASRLVAIFRADSEGEALARFLLGSTNLSIRPVAFFDDRAIRHGVRVCGLPVVNIDTDLQKLRKELKLDVVLVPRQERQREACELFGRSFQEAGLPICTLELNLRLWDNPQDTAATGVDLPIPVLADWPSH